MPAVEDIWSPIRLTLALASITTLLLLALGTPLAWWLARSKAPWKEAVAAIVALPLVLPPTVLGFYLLLALGPHGPGGLSPISQMRRKRSSTLAICADGR